MTCILFGQENRVNSLPPPNWAPPPPTAHARIKANPPGPPPRGQNKRPLKKCKTQKLIFFRAYCPIKRPTPEAGMNDPSMAQGGGAYSLQKYHVVKHQIIWVDVCRCPERFSSRWISVIFPVFDNVTVAVLGGGAYIWVKSQGAYRDAIGGGIRR